MDSVRREKEKQEEEECLREIQLLQLQEKRMKALVEQRRQERKEMDLENSRMERQLKYMKELVQENESAEADWEREEMAKQPFSGAGYVLGAPTGGNQRPEREGAGALAASKAAARLFSGSTQSSGAPPGVRLSGSAGCTGRIGPVTGSAPQTAQATSIRGPGQMLGFDEEQWGGRKKESNSLTKEKESAGSKPTAPAPKPVNVDTSKPTGNVQVRLANGSRLVVKLNNFHTVAHIRQEVRSKQPEETRDFDLVSLGPPAKVLEDDLCLQDGGLLGSAVMQRFV